MTERTCEQCGAANAPDAQFCAKCDFYLGWDTGGGSLTPDAPVTREPYTAKIPAASPPNRPARPHPPQPAQPRATGRPATPPQATLLSPEVEVHPDRGGTVDVRIRNVSSIVDGYKIDAPGKPPWLKIDHPEIRLLTDEEGLFSVSMSIDPRYTVHVQRFRTRVQVCSIEDPSKRTDLELTVVVPRVGGPVTMTAEPPVLRIRDASSGRFRVRLDNTGSNYPQRCALSGTDPERIVRFAFSPHVIEVGPKSVQFVDVRLEVPRLEPGQQANHILTITAGGDDGPIEATVNLIQQVSAAPPDSPVQLRLEPRVVRTRDATSAETSVIVDNRRGSRDRRLQFAGRDPEGSMRFAFSQPQLYVRAGEQARVGVHVSAPLPRPGEEAERQFSVVCHDGNEEREATGSLIQSASATPITTAQVRLDPQHVVVRNRRRGRYRVTVDNTRGALPLTVWLSGSDPEGAARFTFTPPRLEVPPGSLGYSSLVVWADLPGGGKEVIRDITVAAADGVDHRDAQGRFTQSASERLPLLRLLLTLAGGLIVVLGAMRPWFADLPTYYVSLLPQLQDMLAIADQNEMFIAVSQTCGRALVLVLAAVMLLGIIATGGKYTILAGFLTAMLMIGYSIYAISEWSSGGPGDGAVLVVFGAVIAIIGGFCVRRTGP